ncbi:MAG: hypothetical protein H8D72_01075 [Planctomycetes bacterium]|nr:hypothetical protein [Planctomycetota bacterium]
MSKELVIVGGARTPMAEYSGTPGYGKLKGITAIDLAVHATKAALERAGVSADSIDHVVIGNVLQSSAGKIHA